MGQSQERLQGGRRALGGFDARCHTVTAPRFGRGFDTGPVATRFGLAWRKGAELRGGGVWLVAHRKVDASGAMSIAYQPGTDPGTEVQECDLYYRHEDIEDIHKRWDSLIPPEKVCSF